MLIEKRQIDSLLHAGYNPRKQMAESDPEYKALKASIQKYGYVIPIIVNKTTGQVVGGNQRLEVLKSLGYTEIDVVVEEMDEAKEKALNVALNKIKGKWDDKTLSKIMKELDSAGFSVEDLGFSIKEAQNLIKKDDGLMLALDESADLLEGEDTEKLYEEVELAAKKNSTVLVFGRFKVKFTQEELENCLGQFRYRNNFQREKIAEEIKHCILYGNESAVQND